MAIDDLLANGAFVIVMVAVALLFLYSNKDKQ